VLFAGDVLFSRSVGRSDFPGGDHETLLTAVREKIFTLPGDTVVYPGHGPATTVAGEMRHNPFFSEFA
jgi:glyoxylase-like metal-dependent hydrolase (beta-lactamase superfamily II)